MDAGTMGNVYNAQCNVSLCLHADGSVQAKQAQVAGRVQQSLGPPSLTRLPCWFDLHFSVSGLAS